MKKRLFINLIASILAFAIQLGINFILTPYIVQKLGDEAYGFIGLANNFVSYATVLTVTLNSMASRFISIELNRNNKNKANEYYSSIFIADIVLSTIVAVISIVLIQNLTSIVNISQELTFDVKLTFLLVFINFIITIMTTVFNVAVFVKNRIDIQSTRSIISNIIRVIILLLLFLVFKAKIYYISIAAIICSIYLLLTNIRITKKIAPELKIVKEKIKIKAIKIIITSGIWNSLNSFSKILLTGLDLLIVNIFINPSSMGILSIAKIIPTSLESLLGTINGVFTPYFTILYANRRKEEINRRSKIFY